MTQSGVVFASKYHHQQQQHQHEQHQHEYEQEKQQCGKSQPRLNSEILLNNFQIKKKSYRVLLHGNHIVWERLNTKSQTSKTEDTQNQTSKQEQFAQTKVKGVEPYEHEQLAVNCELPTSSLTTPTTTSTPSSAITAPPLAYSSQSHVLHIDEVISVRKGDSKLEASKACSSVSVSGQQPVETVNKIIVKPTAQYLSIHYAERIMKSATDCNRWQVQHLTLYNSDPYIIQQWYEQIHLRLVSSPLRLHVKRLLVFINPYGGRKQGLQTYERYCKPIFELAGIDASCLITQRANQIRDILLSHDLSVFDAVCCVGGDGTVAEVINGLLFRTMRELGLDESRPPYIPKPMLPVGVIPAGSTDTIAYSLHGTSDVATAAIHLVLGQRRGLDVCSVRNSRNLLRFCASVLSYGYLGDVAAQSEQYRWMGTKRYEYSGVKAFICNRGYDAEVRILLDAPEQDQDNLPQNVIQIATSSDTVARSSIDETSVCYANCQRCSIAASTHDLCVPTNSAALLDADTDDDVENIFESVNAVQVNRLGGDVQANLPVDNDVSTTTKVSELSAAETALLRQPKNYSTTSLASDQTEEQYWKTIKGNFFMICGANIACACSRSPNGISRYSHLGDGYLDLILVRKTTLINNMRFLLNTAGRDGDIRNLPFVEVYRTRRFHFRAEQQQHSGIAETNSINGSCQPIAEAFPDVNTECNFSSWNCDGEVVTDLDITMSSHCQLIDVFMRGPHSYTKLVKTPPQTTTNTTNSVFCCCRD